MRCWREGVRSPLTLARATTQIRQKKFEVFWYTHHLFVVYYVLFAGHGMQMVLGDFPMAWCFVIIPCILYGFERVSRAVRCACLFWFVIGLRERC
jgi:NADPH oxidase